jgi:hypothetical protein
MVSASMVHAENHLPFGAVDIEFRRSTRMRPIAACAGFAFCIAALSLATAIYDWQLRRYLYRRVRFALVEKENGRTPADF